MRALGLWLGLGLILSAASELMFWPVPVRDIALLAAIYGLAAVLPMLVLDRAGAFGWPAIALAGGLFGLLVEGVVVQQVYLEMPFSLVWTPLAWHGLLSVGVVVVGLRMALCAHGVGVSVAVCAAIGVFAALWAGYGWTEFGRAEGRTENALPFAAQITVATAMILLGHVVLDRLPAAAPPRWMLPGLAGIAACLWAVTWAVPFFPASLSVPLLGGVSAWAIGRLGAGPDHGRGFGRVAPVRYLALVLVPGVAIPLEAVVRDLPALASFNVPVAGVTVLVSLVVWLWALARAIRGGVPRGPASGSRPGG